MNIEMQLKNSEKPNIKEYKTLNIEDIKENKDINASDDNQIKIEMESLEKIEKETELFEKNDS